MRSNLKCRDEPGEWKALRRGWCYGGEPFRTELLAQMSEKIGRHHGGSERLESAEVKAQRLLAAELARRGWNAAYLEDRRKGDDEKIKIARRLRSETTMTWDWIAEQLVMGTAGHAANRLRKS